MRKQKTGPTRVAIYLRCSTDDQKHGDFTTIDTQREINLRHVTELGGTFAGEYVDEGRSGTNLKRPDWQRLLRDAEAGKFDAVCCTYMSHLARGEVYHIAEYLLGERTVSIELVREKFTPDLAGHVNKQMTILMDGMYPKMVSQWTRTKMEQMVEKGYFCGGTVPYGLTPLPVLDAPGNSRNDNDPPKRLTPDPYAVPIVRHAFTVFAETRSYAKVTEYLRSATGRVWTFQTVTRLIRNEVYRGVLRFGEWVNHTAHEPIVSEALWDAAQAADAQRTRQPKQNPVEDFPFHLRGKVWCPHCGSRMTPMWYKGRLGNVRYYECLAALKKLTTGCPARRVNAVTIHSAIVKTIERFANHPTPLRTLMSEAAKAMPEPADSRRELAESRRRLMDVERRINRCQEAIEEGTGTVRSLVQRLEVLETERLPLEAACRELEGSAHSTIKRRADVEEVCSYWKRWIELWGEATDEEKTDLMGLLVDRVEMRDKERGACRISLIPQAPSHRFELTYQMGAGAGLEPATFGL